VQRWAQDFENKSMALTKAEMAEALFNQLGLNKREARELVDLFFEEVRHALSNGEQVKLSGFGNFDLRDKNQRPDVIPKTGEEIPISARRVVTFPSRSETEGASRGLCWNQRITTNCRQSLASAISRSAK
jgi:integration host factor subunit alpha